MEIIKYGDFKPLGKQKKKSQIILTHTSRNVENYLASLRYRYNGKFDRDLLNQMNIDDVRNMYTEITQLDLSKLSIDKDNVQKAL